MFYRSHALEALASLPHDAIVPAVVFTERARQLGKRGIKPGDFADRLRRNELTIEPYGVQEASRFAPTIHDDTSWRRLARDAMIAGHVRPNDLLWTTNPDDFREIGLPEEAIIEL